MAQFNRLQIGRRGRELLDNQSVFVTHIENPSLFFCRLVTEDEDFARLQALIESVVDQRDEKEADLSAARASDKIVLVYSTIRKAWCRGVIISSVQGSIAKVFLVDYGSIELVVFNAHYVQQSTDEITNFNEGFGYCFPCKLDNLEPFDEIKCKVTDEWSSFSNFMMERETKDRECVLALSTPALENAIVLCDLRLTSPDNGQRSLSQTLVNANVAHYSGSAASNVDEPLFALDNDKENRFVTF